MAFEKKIYLCRMKKNLVFLMLLLVAPFQGCKEYPENPNGLTAIINITINLSDPRYYDLRFDGGFMYLTSDIESNSRGIIVYRVMDEFRAYDRLPPNNPDCINANGNLIRLTVDVPFVVDECNNIRYDILNGYVFDGDGVYGLYRYRTSFDGATLRIYN